MTDSSTKREHAGVVEEVGRRIVSGTYASGQILPREEDLATELGVSRSVMREALRVLASKGLIEARRKRGTQVLDKEFWAQLDPDVLEWRSLSFGGSDGSHGPFWRDLFELRTMIEPEACALAAERATPAEVRVLQGLAREMVLTAHDAVGFRQVDLRFHHALLVASHNALLVQLSSAIETWLRISSSLGEAAHSDHFVGEHVAVAEAIADRHPARARRAMRALIDTGSAKVAAVLDALSADEH
jgi:DNA-binding FadR family transcriptional regulator